MRPVEWTVEKVKAEMLKYTNRSDFRLANVTAYQKAHKYGLIDHLPKRKATRPWKWTDEKIKEVASKFSCRSEMQLRHRSAYMTAYYRGMLDDLFPEKKEKYNTRDCVYIWEVINEPGVYKVGITSISLGEYRIEDVSKRSKLKCKVVTINKVGQGEAKVIESLMKRMGVKFNTDRKFNGHTEFRRLSPSELAMCIEIIEEHSVENLLNLGDTNV